MRSWRGRGVRRRLWNVRFSNQRKWSIAKRRRRGGRRRIWRGSYSLKRG
jgi:hypothetical protein